MSRLKGILIALAFLLCFCCSSGVSADDQEVVLGTWEWKPYTSKDLKHYGAVTKIITTVFQEIGIQPVYEFYPWKRAESYCNDGRLFAVFPYVLTPERQKEFDFSNPLMISTGRFFYKKSKFPNGIKYTGLLDLKPYRIGGVLGYWYENMFKLAGLDAQFVVTDIKNIKKLYSNRVDFAISDELVGWTLIKQMYPGKAFAFDTLNPPLNKNPLRLMISRSYPDANRIKQRFDAGLITIRESGVLGQILRKYGIKE